MPIAVELAPCILWWGVYITESSKKLATTDLYCKSNWWNDYTESHLTHKAQACSVGFVCFQ